MSIEKPTRTVVWSTGGVGAIAIDAISRRPDLKLVGVWVHSPDKVGKDAGELAGIKAYVPKPLTAASRKKGPLPNATSSTSLKTMPIGAQLASAPFIDSRLLNMT